MFRMTFPPQRSVSPGSERPIHFDGYSPREAANSGRSTFSGALTRSLRGPNGPAGKQQGPASASASRFDQAAARDHQ
jgi:hypothetical protein